MTQPNRSQGIGRRAFLERGALILAPATLPALGVLADDEVRLAEDSPLRVGLVTDLHHADKDSAGSRHYRESLGKLSEAAEKFEQLHIDLIVELGDLIDAAPSVELERRYLETVNDALSGICDDRHYVLGNHCVDTLTKEEFLGDVGQKKSFYSFDRRGFHFVVLDSCFRSDGEPYQRRNFKWTDANVPEEELAWLEADLKSNTKPVIVFAHQRLDVSNNHGVKNNRDVRRILEAAGNVLAVFQGHSHKNDLKDINGIHYCTLVAMVEGSGPNNSGYAVMEIHADGTIRLDGFRKQNDHTWRPEESTIANGR